MREGPIKYSSFSLTHLRLTNNYANSLHTAKFHILFYRMCLITSVLQSFNSASWGYSIKHCVTYQTVSKGSRGIARSYLKKKKKNLEQPLCSRLSVRQSCQRCLGPQGALKFSWTLFTIPFGWRRPWAEQKHEGGPGEHRKERERKQDRNGEQ